MILAGLYDGKIAVIKVKGVHTIRTELICMLQFHTTPVMFIQESPCTNYVCSIGEDEVLFVWKHVDADKIKKSTMLTDDKPKMVFGFSEATPLASLR